MFNVNGVNENGAAGALQVTVTAIGFGLANVMIEGGENEPEKPDSAIAVPTAGLEVNGANAPAGQASVQLTGVTVPPRFSLQASVCD